MADGAVTSTRPSAAASRAAIRAVSLPAGSWAVAASASTICLMQSSAARIVVMFSGVTFRTLSRTRPSTFSAAWATRSRRDRPRNPQVPLIVCTMRKISESVSSSFGVRSSLTSAVSSSARLSLVSVRKSASRSSIRHSVPFCAPEPIHGARGANRGGCAWWRAVCAGGAKKL